MSYRMCLITTLNVLFPMKINGGMDMITSFFWGMLTGFFIGGMAGVFIMSLMFVAKSADERFQR